MMEQIEEDYRKICGFLKLDGYLLEVDKTHSGGVCARILKKIVIGVKDGYDRTLLIHECLHAIGYNHNSRNFSGALKYDEVSPMYEKWGFGGRGEPRWV